MFYQNRRSMLAVLAGGIALILFAVLILSQQGVSSASLVPALANTIDGQIAYVVTADL